MPPKEEILAFRLLPQEKESILALAEASAQKPSEVLREAVKAWLDIPDETRQKLGEMSRKIGLSSGQILAYLVERYVADREALREVYHSDSLAPDPVLPEFPVTDNQRLRGQDLYTFVKQRLIKHYARQREDELRRLAEGGKPLTGEELDFLQNRSPSAQERKAQQVADKTRQLVQRLKGALTAEGFEVSRIADWRCAVLISAFQRYKEGDIAPGHFEEILQSLSTPTDEEFERLIKTVEPLLESSGDGH